MSTLLSGLVACILSLVMTPVIIYAAIRKGWFDEVNDRKIHSGKIPRLGGVAIVGSFLIALIGAALAIRGLGLNVTILLPVGAAMLTVHLVGLVDDFKDLKARTKFVFHLGAALLVVAAGVRFRSIYLPALGDVELGLLSYPISVVWIVGLINAVNMIDGLDGLSGGVSIIAAFSFSLLFMGRGLGGQALLSVVLAGSLAGYLFYNFPPAKIFMGDSGSTFLGFILAILPLLGAKSTEGGFWFWDGITILALPIFDVFAAMWRRLRQGRSIMSPDKWHLHHKLLHLGFGPRAILGMVYAACMALGAAAVAGTYLSPFSHWLLVIALWALLASCFTLLHVAKERSLSGGSPSR